MLVVNLSIHDRGSGVAAGRGQEVGGRQMRARTSAAFAAIARLLAPPLSALRRAASYLAAELRGTYRPEKHYMRGPGPKWREKAAAIPACEHRPEAAKPR